MKIIRNEQEIELTPLELQQAYEEKDRQYKIQDFKSRYKLPNNKIDQVIQMFDRLIGNNDGYWEDYWATIEYVAKELKLKEKEEK